MGIIWQVSRTDSRPIPTYRSEKVWDRPALLNSRLRTFETDMLAEQENFAGLGRLNRALIGKGQTMDSGFRTTVYNDSLEGDISGLLTRPVGRPTHKPVIQYKSFLYQAASGKTARRVVGMVEFHFSELFPRLGFIVTYLDTNSRAMVRAYNKRGTSEQ